MIAVNTASSTAVTALKLLTALTGNDKAKGAPGTSPASALSLMLLDINVQMKSASITPPPGQGDIGFEAGIAAVQAEWDHVAANVRKGNLIDGRIFERLTDAIMANRDKFPPGEFTIKFSWPSGASIEETIPAMASMTVQSVSISAVFAQATTYGLSSGSGGLANAQAHYREWQ